MARNEGRKLIDRVEVFAPPIRTARGDLTTLFFARGIRHRVGASDVVAGLQVGDRLRLVDDTGNETNPRAVLVNTRNDERVGWIPDYLVETVHELRDLTCEDAVEVAAEHVNPP